MTRIVMSTQMHRKHQKILVNKMRTKMKRADLDQRKKKANLRKSLKLARKAKLLLKRDPKANLNLRIRRSMGPLKRSLAPLKMKPLKQILKTHPLMKKKRKKEDSSQQMTEGLSDDDDG